MRPKEQRCPGVLESIAKAQRLLDAQKCHCPCVETDIPKATALAAKGHCLGAAKVIKAALARCDESDTGITPIEPWYGGEI